MCPKRTLPGEPKASKTVGKMGVKPVGRAVAAPMGEPERIQKILAAAGLCSRREAEDWIRQGVVTVNGKIATIGENATRADNIAVNGARIRFPEQLYIMLHKPRGFVTTMRDFYGQKTVVDLVPTNERIYPVGRLDKDTTGLIFLTNDGEFANRVMHPRYELEKTYVAIIDKPFGAEDIQAFSRGIRLSEGLVFAKARVLSSRRVEVKLHQGYNHVVRRIFATLGYKVLELARTRIGPVQLTIPLGSYRPLTAAEVESIFAAAKPRPQPRRRLEGEPKPYYPPRYPTGPRGAIDVAVRRQEAAARPGAAGSTRTPFDAEQSEFDSRESAGEFTGRDRARAAREDSMGPPARGFRERESRGRAPPAPKPRRSPTDGPARDRPVSTPRSKRPSAGARGSGRRAR